MKQLVIATGNMGKLQELCRLLAPLDIEVLPQSHFNVPEADEPYSTFVENALAKARHATSLTGLPALADDSGLCVDSLNGLPGVSSAIYAGLPRSDKRNNEKLIVDLANKQNRAAHYHCTLVLMRCAQDPEPLIAEGDWHGELLDAPRGSNGFGYDPYFLDLQYGQTGGELSLDVKNRISHRGRALTTLLGKLKQHPL